MLKNKIVLPPPRKKSEISVEYALCCRRSRRNIIDSGLRPEILSQILWAAYGITEPRDDNNNTTVRLKTTPSAGTMYPLNIFIAIGNVENIKPGLYEYKPVEHEIVIIIEGDMRKDLSRYSMQQEALLLAPFSIIYTAELENGRKRYSLKGKNKYIFTEIGHSSQNVHLQAESLELATYAVGEFETYKLQKLLSLHKDIFPLYIMPVGRYEVVTQS